MVIPPVVLSLRALEFYFILELKSDQKNLKYNI